MPKLLSAAHNLPPHKEKGARQKGIFNLRRMGYNTGMALKIYIITLLIGLAVGVIFSKLAFSIAAVHILIAFAFIILLGCASKESMRIPLLLFYFLIFGVGLLLLFYGADKYQLYNEFIFLKFSLPISLPLALILYLFQKKKLAKGAFYTTKKRGESVDEQIEVLGQDVYTSYMALPIRDIKVLLALSGFIIFTLFTWGFFIFTNGFFDNSSPQNHRAIVIKKRAEHVKESRYIYYLSFNHWDSKDIKTIEVDKISWESVKKSDTIWIKTQKGFYNVEWIVSYTP